MAPAEKAAAKERQRAGLKRGKQAPLGKVSTTAKARDKIGAFAGVSGRTVEKIARVVEAAEERAGPRPWSDLGPLSTTSGC
jgi:hypothetical protein